jgi:hypothetical protein
MIFPHPAIHGFRSQAGATVVESPACFENSEFYPKSRSAILSPAGASKIPMNPSSITPGNSHALIAGCRGIIPLPGEVEGAAPPQGFTPLHPQFERPGNFRFQLTISG